MAVWIPVLKAALPYVSNLVATALPVFTSKKEQDASAELVARQIAELQTAVTGNAEAVKGLAAQLEKTITALEAGESDLSRRFAGLQEGLGRCESAASLLQAQTSRQESGAAAMQIRIDALDQQLASERRRGIAIALVAALALIVAVFALLR